MQKLSQINTYPYHQEQGFLGGCSILFRGWTLEGEEKKQGWEPILSFISSHQFSSPFLTNILKKFRIFYLDFLKNDYTAESDELCISDCGSVNISISCWEPSQQIAISQNKITFYAQKVTPFGQIIGHPA